MVPSNELNPIFGKVSCRRLPSGEQEVKFTIRLSGLGEEHWHTAVALDASSSMQTMYGWGFQDNIPADVRAEYYRSGGFKQVNRDGCMVTMMTKEAHADAVARGFIVASQNQVEPEARKFLEFLSGSMDKQGSTLLAYWACGTGQEFEIVGKIETAQCGTLKVGGPQTIKFGSATHLLPILSQFETQFQDAGNSFFVFLTDGKLDDLDAVKVYCTGLAQRIERGERGTVKCILIGLGNAIDEKQLIELDDLDTGTDVDIWDHKIAQDMREVTEIFAEMVDETMIIAPSATLYDDTGAVAARLSDGLPARVTFTLPAHANGFELEVPGSERIRQPLRAA